MKVAWVDELPKDMTIRAFLPFVSSEGLEAGFQGLGFRVNFFLLHNHLAMMLVVRNHCLKTSLKQSRVLVAFCIPAVVLFFVPTVIRAVCSRLARLTRNSVQPSQLQVPKNGP